MKSEKRLTRITLLAGLLGYIWLGLVVFTGFFSQNNDFGVCVFRNLTGIPCPSCGSTRSVIALLKGDLIQAICFNPIGIILLIGLVVFPPWIVWDQIKKRNSFIKFYCSAEEVIRKKWFYIPAIILIVFNWIWNIKKGY